ncbi:MAG: hypothetical protein ACTS5P_02015 [Candidatus Hodgkinia cicadicola]
MMFPCQMALQRSIGNTFQEETWRTERTCSVGTEGLLPQRTWLRGSFRGGGYIGLIDKEEIEAAVLVSSLFACEMCNRSEER